LGNFSFGNELVPAVDNTLELSATDNSYFVLAEGNKTVYASSMLLFFDKEGFLIDEFSNELIGYPEVKDGAVTGKDTIDFERLVSFRFWSSLSPKASNTVTLNINLNSQDLPAAKSFDHFDASSYNVSYETSLYDSLGDSYSFRLFFTQTEEENEWQMHYLFIDPEITPDVEQLGGPYTLIFDDQGVLISDQLVVQSEFLENRYNGAIDIGVIEIDISTVTQSSLEYTANIQQNGYTYGHFNRLQVENCGRVVVSYSNNIDFVHGQLGLASFQNPAGLIQNSDGLFVETETSGTATLGTACNDGIAEINGDDIY